ncbi:MAG: DUF3305 domain-containing protein [Geminicoccaceae bacterium]|nr:DUF3305 domain-containing protein [Geminicoccaceae bacterium]MCS7268626.1 DUF3305 domain-containing protein [Geminicoccaceae bacterium]MCX7629302.1 DUF3305 domain-containing protein [Geminicoccaceae bacterium]MDW8125355.1 DUF3305 domain-containing protein [Geminicoccaceae bacterium]MDW8341867.1 DUF3305 domain-containing protein [Geminicoccaceae bacterium]
MDAARAVLELGIVVERRKGSTRWAEWIWRPVEVVPGVPASRTWRRLVEGDGWVRWLAGTLPLVLHRAETADYRVALSAEPPQLYVVLRANEDDPEFPWKPFLLTASPFEAQVYAEPGDAIVEAVPMPEPVVAFVQEFVDRHHKDVPFLKRRRKRADAPPDAQSEFVSLGGAEEER